MPMNRSFRDNASNRFYNELFAAISDFQRAKNRLSVFSQTVRQIDTVSLSDIEVKNVFVNDLSGMEIKFEVLAEAAFEITEADRFTTAATKEADDIKYSVGEICRVLSMIFTYPAQ